MRERGEEEANYPPLACDVGQITLRMMLDQDEEKELILVSSGPPIMDIAAGPWASSGPLVPGGRGVQ